MGGWFVVRCPTAGTTTSFASYHSAAAYVDGWVVGPAPTAACSSNFGFYHSIATY